MNPAECQIKDCPYYAPELNDHACRLWSIRSVWSGQAMCAGARAVNLGILRVIDEVAV